MDPETDNLDLPDVTQTALDWHLRLTSGAASDADWAAFAVWLGADEAHAQAFGAVEAVLDRVDAVSEQVRIRYATELPSKDRTPEAAPNSRPRLLDWLSVGRRPFVAAAIAASLLLVVGGVGVMEMTASNMIRYATATGEVRQVTLPDGSTADLDTDTVLEVAYSKGERDTTLLKGRAIFDVRHNPSRPFTVAADGREVKVLGTRFEVSAIDDDVSVSVARGSVGVSSKVDAAPAPVVLAPGDRLVFAANTSVPRREKVNLSDFGTWAQHRLTYSDTPLSRVLADVNRYFPGTPFRVDSKDLAALPFTGSLYVDDGETMARNLSSFMSLTYRRDGNSYVLEPKAPDAAKN